MIKKILKYSAITVIWLVIWQVAAALVGQDLLFPGPITVATRLFFLATTLDFYKIIAYSLIRILIGMVIGSAVGVVGGILTAVSRLARDFFAPVLAIMKATPVASFIILLVLWLSRDITPLIIALMMVTPVVWTGVETGILNTDRSLIEMSRAYKMSTGARLRQILLPSVTPYLLAALKSSLGMAWKAGIAAEVLLLPLVSIGKMIAESKTNLETVDLFAWTVVVVVMSVVIEKITVFVLKKALKNHSLGEKGGVAVG